MKKIIPVVLLIFCLAACSTEETNLSIKAEISGLKKGTVYLQKIEDTSLVNIDSVKISSTTNFSFNTNIEEPQILYLGLKKEKDNTIGDRFGFFAEKGEMTIQTSLENFGQQVAITGSENQEKLSEYQEVIKRFNNQNLDLLKERLEAEQSNNDTLILQAVEKANNLLKRKYLYTINFAVNNKDKEMAPYITLAHAYDANIKYLDTVYNSLTPKVQSSLYGNELGNYINERRELEQETNLN